MQARFDSCLDGLLPSGGAVLLAVSGGIDSIVMADLFLNSAVRRKTAIAHCNFHLRGEESDRDEDFVRRWAESRGLPFLKADFRTEEYSSSNGVSIEMAARELRYSWFASLCAEGGYSAVAVAHNANDNAETMVLNLLRGTGIDGICGMKESSLLMGSGTALLIRPLLGFSREEIHEYALARGLSWCEDSTNSDSTYKRNLVRNEIFPLFGKVNPSFLATLSADMRRFSQVKAVSDDYLAARSPEVMRDNVIDVGKLLEEPRWEFLLYMLMRRYGFNEATTDALASLIRNGKTFSGRTFLSADYIAQTSRGRITILPSGKAMEVGEVTVAQAGEYSLGGVRFVVGKVDVEDPRTDEGTTVADLGFPFTVRHWRPGDWMRPLGMGGRRKKLSDMFTDLKFSLRQKEEALVIAGEGSHVLALVGYRIDESVRVAPGPAIRIRLI